MALKITIGFILSLILLILFFSCDSGFLRKQAPDFIKLGSELEYQSELLTCASAVFELKNKDIDVLRKQLEDSEYWEHFPTLEKFYNTMSASLKVIFCGKVLNKYSKIFTDMTEHPGKYPNAYYYVSGDELFIAVLTDEKLVFISGGN